MTRMTLGALVLTAFVGAACAEHSGEADILAARVSDAGGAPVEVTRTFDMPVRATASAEMSGCDNSPGPYITLSGDLALGGLGSRLTFRNNAKGTHEYSNEAQVELVVVPAGESITIPKQPVLGGTGGNPFIWLQFTDSDGAAVSGEIYLGRCVQGLTVDASADFASLARALASIAVESCENSPGPYIRFGGELGIRSGVNANVIFRNNDNPVGGPHEATEQTVVTVRLLPPGHTITFPKQPVLGGVGGNPWISFAFLSASGALIGDEALIGRCEQLSKSIS